MFFLPGSRWDTCGIRAVWQVNVLGAEALSRSLNLTVRGELDCIKPRGGPEHCLLHPLVLGELEQRDQQWMLFGNAPAFTYKDDLERSSIS